MKLAVLGTDPDVLALLTAAAAEAHRIVWLGDVRPDDAAAVRQVVPATLASSSAWEMLLDQAMADAVLVGRGTAGDELRAEQLRRIAAEAVPMLVVHPAVLSVLAYYELDMLRRETGGILRHYNPLVGRPIVAELTRWVREGHDEIGSVHQLSCTRRVAGAAREVVLAQLARDVELLAAVAGDIRQVSAIGPASPSASYASLQVQMTSASAATLHWSVAPATRGDTGGIELVLVGERGTATLDQQSGSNQSSPEFILRLSTQDMQATALPEFNAPRAAIRGLATAVELRPPSTEQAARDKRLSGTSPAPGSPLPAASTWPKATQAMEVVDSIELSLQKGRTIDVHQQQLTEQLAFRGTMAAFGCGLLLLGLFAVFVISLFGGLEKAMRQPIFRGWPIVLLGVLCLFLLLQAVPLLAAKTKRPTANDPPRAEE